MKYLKPQFKYSALFAMLTAAIFSHGLFANAVTTDCSTDLSSNGATYTLSADTSNTCNITGADITLDGNSHSIGSSPLAFPDNSSSGGWLNMTGNVLLMHMNDSSGSIADTSGNTNTGTVNGSLTYGASGQVGNSLYFNGSTYLTIPGSASMNIPSNTMSLSFWVRPGHTPSNEALFAQRDPMNFQMYADWQGSGPWFMFGGQTCDLGQALPANTWTLLTFTYDGTNIRDYRNGNLVNTCNQPGAMNFSSNIHTAIGTDFYGHNFLGHMD